MQGTTILRESRFSIKLRIHFRQNIIMGPEADEDKSPEVVDLSADSSLQVDRENWGIFMLLALKKFPLIKLIVGIISVHTLNAMKVRLRICPNVDLFIVFYYRIISFSFLRSTFPTPCPRRTRSSLPSTRAPRCRSLPRTSSRWRAFTRTSSGCTTTFEVCVSIFVTKGLKPVVNAHGRNSHQPYFSAVYICDKFVAVFRLQSSDGNKICFVLFSRYLLKRRGFNRQLN